MKRRHVILIGLPGAGKTTVARLVAERLGGTAIDFDAVIEARAGKSVERIFAEDGEPAFRALEATVGAEALAGEPAILSPGGGFFQDAVQRRLALVMGYVVYLMTAPAVAARRLEGSPSRPLLKGFEPALRLHLLLEQRRGTYLEAQARVTTDLLTPEAVAADVAQLARTHGGW